MQSTKQFKKNLTTLKQEVTRRIEDISRDTRHEGMSADWTEQATERENDEVLLSLGDSAQRELVMINTALKRIDAGEYYNCSVCSDQIVHARLELLPFSSLCVNCADKLEDK